ncbi:SPFH domain-containing protein [Aquitalea pelogenes]|uniref:SPFH domain-containing protein n=1 Tax=Aquitalea pelogenes TaxID=1293573 RepID=UPI0019567525|nr:SPFH domain-containing protein [Aquitalea pelogenes]
MATSYKGAGIVAALAAVWLLSSSFYTLSEGQKGLIIRLGAPIEVDAEPGLKFKLPLVDSLQFYDVRLQTLARRRSRSSWAMKNGWKWKPIPATALPTRCVFIRRCVPRIRRACS